MEARREVIDDRSFTTALSQALEGEPERLSVALEQLGPALQSADLAARRRARLLVRELVAQSLGTSAEPLDLPLELTATSGADTIRLEARGPAVHFLTGGEEGVAASRRRALGLWGAFIVENLADRWGWWDSDSAWFEIDKRTA